MVDAIEVLSAALSVNRLRVNVASSNLANAETTHTAEGGAYKRKDVVIGANRYDTSFSSTLDRLTLSKPQVVAVVEDQSEGRKVFEPGHPDADPQGFVSYPNVNPVSTMTDLMSASRMYQAVASAVDTTRSLDQAARSIGQGS